MTEKTDGVVCPQLVIHREDTKDHIEGVEKVVNKRIDTMRIIIVSFVLTSLTFIGTYSLWAADKKDVQEDKVTKLEVEMVEHNKAWERREKLDSALMKAIINWNSYMVEQKTKMKIYHPGG